MTATSDVQVHPSNAAQLRAWDGDEGSYWAAHADAFDRSVHTHHVRLMAAAAVATTDRVLDVGCGTGQVSRDAARAATSGSALGVDLSSAMLDHARRQAAAEGLTNVTFEQADAQIHPFSPAAFDVAISRTGAMFFGDRLAAFRNLGSALRPGGRLVLLTWQAPERNEWFREITTALSGGRPPQGPPPGAPSPFALSDPDHVRDLLREAGYSDITIDGDSAGMWFGDHSDDACAFIVGLLGWMLEGLDDAVRDRAVDTLRRTLTEHETPDGVLLDSATWTIVATNTTRLP